MFRNERVIVVDVQLGTLALPVLLLGGHLERHEIVAHHVVLGRFEQQRRLLVHVRSPAARRQARDGGRLRDGRLA